MVSPPAAPSEPPRSAPSCAHANTLRPDTRPCPATTPSPTALRSGANVPGSQSRSIRASGSPYSTGVATAALMASCARDRQARVLAPEPEGVRERELGPGRLAGPVGQVVGVALGVGLLVVDRGGKQPAPDRPQPPPRLDRARRAEQMPDRG